MVTALVLAGCYAGFVLSSATGVGGALVMIPLLVLVVPAGTAVALSTPVMLVNNVGKTWLLRAELRRDVLGRSLLGAAPGGVAGAALVGIVPATILRRAIGLFMIGYAAHALLVRDGAEPRRRLGLVGWGAITGLASGLVGAGGPTNAAAMREAGLTRGAFIATGAAISVALQLVKLPVFAASGVLRARDLPWAAALSALAIAGAWTGRALVRRMSDRIFSRLLLVVLIGLGATMLR